MSGKKVNLSSGMGKMFLGIFMIFIFGIGALSFRLDPELSEPGLIEMTNLFIILGFVLAAWGQSQYNLKVKRYPIYERWIKDTKDGSISEQAKYMKIRERKLKKEIHMLLVKGLVEPFTFDEEHNIIVTEQVKEWRRMLYSPRGQNQMPPKEQKADSEPKISTYTCHACGGVNKDVSNPNADCAYCGIPLSHR